MTPHTEPPGRSPALAMLLVEIETAWIRDRDADLPIRLSEEHPDLANDLLDFFDDLVLSSVPPTATDRDRADASARLAESFRRTGQSALADAIERSQSLSEEQPDVSHGDPSSSAGGGHLSLVPSHTTGIESAKAPEVDLAGCQSYYDYANLYGHGPAEIAKAFDLPVATTHALILHSGECPHKAQVEMARRGAKGLKGVELDLGLRFIAGRDVDLASTYQRAASRSTGYGDVHDFSYTDTIRNAPSSFPADKRAFWLSLV